MSILKCFSSRINKAFTCLSRTYANQSNNLQIEKSKNFNKMTQKNIFFLDGRRREMYVVFQNFESLWSKALLDPNDKSTVNAQFFHKARLDAALYKDMSDALKDEFYNSKHNIFETHLFLIETALKEKDNARFKFAQSAFINQTFIELYNQLMNQCKRTVSKLQKDQNTDQSAETHLIAACKNDQSICFCSKSPEIVQKAFELTLAKNVSLLSSFNKIYQFKDHMENLDSLLKHYMQKINFEHRAMVIGELHLQEDYPLEKTVVPLMLLDKYPCIDEYINKAESTALEVVGLCDRLCSPSMNLREYASTFDQVQRKKIDRFKTKVIAKYASSCLKNIKKSNLLAIKYKNIALQLKVTQMRFLVNLRYDKWGGDPISYDAWSELVLDLVGDEEILHNKLLLEIIQYKKDIRTAHKFLNIFGVEKNLLKLPESIKEFYLKNIEVIHEDDLRREQQCDNKPSDQSTNPTMQKKFYYPHEHLNERNIHFVDTVKRFDEMLGYFEESKPTMIGLDCEWKPSFDLIDTSNENEKRHCASTLQIATREQAYIIDIKFLIDTLDPDAVDKFGELVLFNENLMKFGYSFQQDANKLSMSFPKFVHKFSEFAEDVVNIDEVVAEFQKNWTLFPDLPKPTLPKDKKQRGAKGLSELTRKCFGAPLDKSECMSNWDLRPLRMAQLKYGALDAFVLIQIHDFIQDRCKTLGVEFDYNSKKNFF